MSGDSERLEVHPAVHPPLHLEMRGIRKSFAGVEVLHGIDLTVESGEVHALVGENGAGKSTLVKILAGDIPADEGSVLMDGRHVTLRSPQEAQRAGVAMIQQELSYVGAVSVAENLMLGRLPSHGFGFVNRAGLRESAAALLRDAGLRIDPGSRMDLLTMSQRQLIEILRALNRSARLIIMDEPTSSLNRTEVQLLFEFVGRLRSQGVAVIYISHHLDEVFSVADRVSVLRDGLRVATREIGQTSHEELVGAMVGGELESEGALSVARDDFEAGEVVCEVKHLSLEPDVRDVSFTVRAGEIYALYGLVGGGQERIARSLYGLETEHAGLIRIGGRSVDLRSPQRAVAAGIGFVPSDRKSEALVPRRAVRENATYPSLRQLLSRAGVLRLGTESRIVERISKRLRIRGEPRQLVGSLSGGNQQKVVVSRWLVKRARLLVLCDPTRGVDVRAKSEIHTLVREVATSGVAVVVVSADLPEVIALADRIGIVRRGRLLAEREARLTTAEEVLGIAAGGIAA